MTVIKRNPLLKGASGMIGRTIVFRQWQGKVVMANRPEKRTKISAKQKVQIKRFRKATQYAKVQMKNPEEKAEYASGIAPNKNTAFRVAVTDSLNAPVVHYIKAPSYKGAVGDTITIKATDDFKVVSVEVTISGRDGKVLEKGDAVRYGRKPFMWKYRTTRANPKVKGTVIQVTASDKPQNRTNGEIVL